LSFFRQGLWEWEDSYSVGLDWEVGEWAQLEELKLSIGERGGTSRRDGGGWSLGTSSSPRIERSSESIVWKSSRVSILLGGWENCGEIQSQRVWGVKEEVLPRMIRVILAGPFFTTGDNSLSLFTPSSFITRQHALLQPFLHHSSFYIHDLRVSPTALPSRIQYVSFPSSVCPHPD